VSRDENRAVFEVRVLGADDWPLWRTLRRSALAESPDAFGSTQADWSGPGDTEARWRARLSDVPLNLALFLADAPVGMVSATAQLDSNVVEVISLWVAPKARGHAVGDLAPTDVLGWGACAHPERTVVLSIRENNVAAHCLYARHGFDNLAGVVPGGTLAFAWRSDDEAAGGGAGRSRR
jgi:ribosomal protein S18 acetylase RimI-like enzyme